MVTAQVGMTTVIVKIMLAFGGIIFRWFTGQLACRTNTVEKSIIEHSVELF